MIKFSPEIGFWSKFIFWYCLVNAVATAGFTLVVIVGGLRDVKYLITALKTEAVDESDDGRVPPEESGPRTRTVIHNNKPLQL